MSASIALGDADISRPGDVMTADTADAPVSAASPATKSLDKSLLVGIAWTGGMKWAVQLLSWASTVVITRLLTPMDLGILGMANVYVNLVALVNEFGLGTAILRRRDLSEDDIAQLGGFGIALGMFFTAVTVLLAGPVAAFFHSPAVHPVVILLSLNFVIAGVGILPRVLLTRDLKFQRLAQADGAANVVQIAVTIVLAALGFRYYSLVWGSLAGAALGTALVVYWCAHRVALPTRMREISDSVAVGWHVTVRRIAWYIYQNADFAIVGRRLGTAVLGGYTVGWEIATVPVERVSVLVGQVTPGIFAELQSNVAALRRYYLGIVGSLAFVTFPAAVGVALTAPTFVPVLFGERWRTAIIPLQLLAAYAGIRSIDTIAPQVLVFTGHSRESMWITVRAAIIMPLVFLVASRWGAAGVAASWVVAFPIVIAPAYRILFRTLEISPRELLRSLAPALGGSLVMALTVLATEFMMRRVVPPRALLAAEIVVGVATYSSYAYLVHRDRVVAFRDMLRRARH